MIAGRKLLLADDSVAIQKVIDLTFTDEGMEVTTVGDGQDALARLEQSTPDVVLADVYMPGVDGYELCKFIKQDERFRGVPVMLLVGSFEPFDEAEAKLAGADDVVTKPFQSIRDLVSRVGSLVRRDDPHRQGVADSAEHAGEDNGATPADSVAFEAAVSETPQVKVFVEAPMMESADTEAAVEQHTCPPDIELQTADTQQLQPVAHTEFDETIHVEVVDEAQDDARNTMTTMAVAPEIDDDGVLDLGDVDSFMVAQTAGDFELDLDLEPVAVSSAGMDQFAGSTDAALATDARGTRDSTGVKAGENDLSHGHLSPEAIEAISRRVVEKLSDEIVREIAWEVVPELSELLIRKRLQEQR